MGGEGSSRAQRPAENVEPGQTRSLGDPSAAEVVARGRPCVHLERGASARDLRRGEVVSVEPVTRAGDTHFWLRYLTGYLAHPVGVERLRADRALKPASFLKSGPAGTAFLLTAPQAERLAALVSRRNPGTALPGRRLPARADTRGLALSVRQPWAEQILQGVKDFEYRSFTTHKRGRVMLYASEGKGEREKTAMKRLRIASLPTGVIIGSVEIVGATRLGPGEYAWSLRRPVRLKTLIKPRRRPQPAFFRPFKAN